MAGRHLITLSALLGATASAIPAWAQQEVDFVKKLAAPANGVIVIETHPTDQVLVFSGGVHSLAGRELIIRAPRVRIDKTTVIQSYDPEDAAGSTSGVGLTGPSGGPGGLRVTHASISEPTKDTQRSARDPIVTFSLDGIRGTCESVLLSGLNAKDLVHLRHPFLP